LIALLKILQKEKHNTIVVFHIQILVQSKHCTSFFLGASGGILSYKVDQFLTNSLPTLWNVFFADIGNNGKVLSKKTH